MATKTRVPGTTTVTLPRWWPIAGVVAALLIGGLAGALVVMSRPSKAEKAIEQMLASAPAQPTADFRQIQKEAGFSDGLYPRANPNAKNGADVVASFLHFLFAGKVDQALRFVENPNEPSIRHAVSVLSGAGEVPIMVYPLKDPAISGRDYKAGIYGPIRVGYEYYTEAVAWENNERGGGNNVYLKRLLNGNWVIIRIE